MTIEIRNRWTNAVIRTVDAADLSWANLSWADLSWANPGGAKDDFLAVLTASPNEIEGLLFAIRDGKIDGTEYEGSCACLKGTIANIRGCSYYSLGGGVMTPNGESPSEKLFLAIRPGHTPENNPISKIVESWILEWQGASS